MTRVQRGVLLGCLHVALVASVGARLAVDRARYPRVWARTVPVDPELPIRGRYVRLRVEVDARGFTPSAGAAEAAGAVDPRRARLSVDDDRLAARPDERAPHRIVFEATGDGRRAVLQRPLAFFIPPDAADPSRRAPGEELWIEVTVPPRGAPRPIRLGVRKDGVLTPLEIRGGSSP